VKRPRLIVPQEYISALEEVLSLRLSDEQVRTREGKKRLDEIAHHVLNLNQGLTTEREEFLLKRYLKDPDIRRAYALYYTTTNLLKPYIPLKELFFEKNLTGPLRVLDLGAGTGAASFGLLYFLQQRVFTAGVDLTLVDAVRENLHDASKLITAYAKSLPFKIALELYPKNILDDELLSGKEFDLILMMNTVNELDEQHASQLLQKLSSLLSPTGSLLVIEPAAREASRRLLSFRDNAVLSSYTVYAPCTRQANCPALINENDWCHTEVDWERPAFVRYIDDLIGTLRLSLKYTYVILNRNGETLSSRLERQELSRVVSDVFKEKGRTRFYLCDPGGRREHIINKRDISNSTKDVKDLERYDLVQISNIEQREHDVRITSVSDFTIVLPKSGA
jgi:ribosomal protein RSM22 (predicted rRNA methylase)